jgi:hypothetical protein
MNRREFCAATAVGMLTCGLVKPSLGSDQPVELNLVLPPSKRAEARPNLVEVRWWNWPIKPATSIVNHS